MGQRIKNGNERCYGGQKEINEEKKGDWSLSKGKEK